MSGSGGAGDSDRPPDRGTGAHRPGLCGAGVRRVFQVRRSRPRRSMDANGRRWVNQSPSSFLKRDASYPSGTGARRLTYGFCPPTVGALRGFSPSQDGDASSVACVCVAGGGASFVWVLLSSLSPPSVLVRKHGWNCSGGLFVLYCPSAREKPTHGAKDCRFQVRDDADVRL